MRWRAPRPPAPALAGVLRSVTFAFIDLSIPIGLPSGGRRVPSSLEVHRSVYRSDASATRETTTVTTTYRNVPTQTVEVGGRRLAYRRLGPDSGVPVIFLNHLAAVLDNWDPRVVDGIAAKHPVITFDGPGVGASQGRAPETVAEMARDAIAFIGALGFTEVDLLGFSLGGFVAQEIVRQQPAPGPQTHPRRHRSRRRRGHRQSHRSHHQRLRRRRPWCARTQGEPLLHHDGERQGRGASLHPAPERAHR